MVGWVKLHRDLQSWQWASSPKHMTLFIHLLLAANHKKSFWRGEHIAEGQLVTGRKQLSLWTGLSESQIRSSLKDFKTSREITIKTTNKYSIITILNWSQYQTDDQQIANKSPTNRQQIATSKNVKNVKNVINIPEQFFADIIDYLNHKTGRRFSSTTSLTRKAIRARMNELKSDKTKYSVSDFKHVIDVKTKQWQNTKMESYLRPETLFGNKFESYLNEVDMVDSSEKRLINILEVDGWEGE